MKYITLVAALLCATIFHASAQSGVVVKGGLVWNDYLRDNQSILQYSQAGSTLGLDVRLGAEDNTYFKLGGYYLKMHMMSQDHSQETHFFKVKNGYELLKATCGVESRLVVLRNFNWRLAVMGAFSFISGVKGSVSQDDLSSGMFAVHLTTGIDLSFMSLDLALEPGLTDFLKAIEDTKPFMMMLTTGFRF
ncbi:MAG: hypothetical protein KDC53_03035 [Saprospiraceae bacterium]|nr:hypothetical protein [Saprospiraceae bacterium]